MSVKKKFQKKAQKKSKKLKPHLLTFGQFAEGLSIDDQMRISREAAQ